MLSFALGSGDVCDALDFAAAAMRVGEEAPGYAILKDMMFAVCCVYCSRCPYKRPRSFAEAR